MKYRTILGLALAGVMMGCSSGSNTNAEAKREADRQAMKMEDLEKQHNTLKTKIQQLEDENAALRKERDELKAKAGK